MKFVTTLSDPRWFDAQDLTGAFLHIYDCVTKERVDHMIQTQGRPAVILSDHMTLDHTVPSDIASIFLPFSAVREARKWTRDDAFDTEPQSQATLCFMANKKALTRSLCIRMVEIFGFQDYLYTWSGLGRHTDMSIIIQELQDLGEHAPVTAQQRHQLLAPIHMAEHFVGNRTSDASGVSFGYDGNRQSWDQGLCYMFQRSVVALITETYVPQPAAVFTEKTVYAMLGCNFPIWVGGHRQARYWKQFGFDTFDDVIDHSYQDHTTLVERCWNAMAKNQKILSDLDHARDLRETHWQRLCDNRDRLLDGQLDQYLEQQISRQPSHFKPHILAVHRLLL